MSAEKQKAAELVADVLTSKGFLFELKVSQWGGKARLTEEDLGLSGLTRDDLHRLGHRQLVPREELAKISAIATRARTRLTHVSYAFPLGGARFVPVGVLGGLLADLDRIRADFTQQVEAFCLHYNEVAEAHRAVWRENACRLHDERLLGADWLEAFEARLLSAYPTVDDVRDSFSLSWAMFQFALPKSVRLQLVQGEQALEAARLADEARRQVEEQVQGFVGEAANELRRRAGEQLAHVARQVRESGEKVTERSLAPLRDLIQQFRALDFTGDEGFAAELERFQAEHLTGDVAKQARGSADFRESLASALTTMADRAVGESETAAAEALDRFLRFGRQGRAIEEAV